MQWENLTAPEFAEAVRETGVCVFPMGICERHSDHLPIGQDFLAVHKIACLAAEKEPAVVFPPWYFGQIFEAKCWPGAVSIGPELLFPLLEGVFDEIGRNGFKKIFLLDGHGGNRFLVPFIAQLSLNKKKPYSLYMCRKFPGQERKEWDETVETELHWHACECETSIGMAVHPELVKTDAIPKEPGEPLKRLEHLGEAFTGIGWYADFPEHYAGDANFASPEKGKKLLELRVNSIAAQLAAVKADEAVPALEREFFDRVDRQAKGE